MTTVYVLHLDFSLHVGGNPIKGEPDVIDEAYLDQKAFRKRCRQFVKILREEFGHDTDEIGRAHV